MCCKIEVLSHAFIVTEVHHMARKRLFDFARPMIKYGRRRQGRFFVTFPDKVYSWANAARTEFRFHRNQLDDFVKWMSEYHGKPEITHRPMYVPDKVKGMALSKDWQPRENQIPVIEYGISAGSTKVIALQTGHGKTSCSLKIAELISERMMVMVLGRYYDKWRKDIIAQYKLKPKELVCVKGTKQLLNLLEWATTDSYNPKCILITIGTMIRYIQFYYNHTGTKPDWLVPPDKIYEHLRVGLRNTDEVHQHFHENYTLELFTHIPKAMYLSATLECDDKLANEMTAVALPLSCRINGGKYVKVSDCIAMQYQLKDPDKVRYISNGSYHHATFEDSILKRKGSALRYFESVGWCLKEYHLPRVRPGQKALIWCAAVETCTALVDYLRDMFPHLRIVRYAATTGDSLDEVYSADITVSTLGSAGTALDIPGLLTCIMTTAIDSRQANEQALGRNRDLKSPGQTPLFIYYACMDITKQMDYHNRKQQDIFYDKVLSYQTLIYGIKI